MKIKTGRSVTRDDQVMPTSIRDNRVLHDSLRPIVEAETPDDAVTAMLIIAGAHARFVMNRWVVWNDKGQRTAVRAAASPEEWLAAMRTLVPGTSGE